MDQTLDLQPLMERARSQTDFAARSLAVLLSQDLEAERKLQLLLEYRKAYQARFQEAAQRGVAHTEWSNYREFMLKLDTAIAGQYQVMAGARGRTEDGRGRYRELKQKQKSFDTLATRRRLADALRLGRREQKDLDERSAIALFHGVPGFGAR